ncbi:MAG: hypothetical protein FJ276_37490, partial [Planctomycetes bacterium]|nr:hypothetical protein [Planctomycetota bacterium]
RMRERGIPFLRLNTEDFGDAFRLTISMDSREAVGFAHLTDGRTIRTDEITGAYIRRPALPNPAEDVEDTHRDFAAREMIETLRSFWTLIPDERWLNPPNALHSAAVKTRQLMAARQCGFDIPPTCVSDHAGAIAEFTTRWNAPFISKAVKSGFVSVKGEYRLAATTRLPATFPADLADYAATPAMYQPEIRKAHDLRVTVVDDRVYAAAIYSQEAAETEVDWRVDIPGGTELRHEAVALEPQVEEACRRITRVLGLRYSAIDLIRTMDGGAVFLEVNPNGEWMWLEDLCGFPLRDTIIDALARAA